MNNTSSDNLDQLILEEKELVAEAHFLDAWESGILDGIDAEILAKVFIEKCLHQLAHNNAPQTISALIRQLSKKDETGEFLPGKILQ